MCNLRHLHLATYQRQRWRMVNRGLRPLFENPRLSRCAHSNSSVRRANINFFTLIFFTCVKDFAQEEGRNVVKLLLYLEDY